MKEPTQDEIKREYSVMCVCCDSNEQHSAKTSICYKYDMNVLRLAEECNKELEVLFAKSKLLP